MKSWEMYEELDEMFGKGAPAQEIENYLETILYDAEHAGDKDVIIAACNELGGLCRAKNDFERSKVLHFRVLELLEEMGQEGSENYAAALINYADVFATSGEMTEALELFLEAKDLLEKCGLQKDYRMAALCNNISRVYISMERQEEAETALTTAFDIISGMPDKWQETATTHISMGDLQSAGKKFDQALDSFHKAAAMFESHGVQDQHYAAALAGAARTYYMMGDYKASEDKYLEAAGLIKQLYGENATYRMLMKNLDQVRSEAD